MRHCRLSAALVVMLSSAGHAQTQAPPSVPLGQARPQTPGVTRTTIRDDAKSTVTRVRFAPGAVEPPHTHPYDVIIVSTANGTVDLGVGDKKITSLKIGEVQFIPREVDHHLTNTGAQPFALIAIGVK